jgi:hypothetical protein
MKRRKRPLFFHIYNDGGLCYCFSMPRQSRIDAPGALHHVIARGIERRNIFINNLDFDSECRRAKGSTIGFGKPIFIKGTVECGKIKGVPLIY